MELDRGRWTGCVVAEDSGFSACQMKKEGWSASAVGFLLVNVYRASSPLRSALDEVSCVIK